MSTERYYFAKVFRQLISANLGSRNIYGSMSDFVDGRSQDGEWEPKATQWALGIYTPGEMPCVVFDPHLMDKVKYRWPDIPGSPKPEKVWLCLEVACALMPERDQRMANRIRRASCWTLFNN